ncbi:MAG TPA: FtsX-like permease family protein [Candidatus Sulfomarinibacteraceae bacterium]|nr:FtsX-like permease family protein [Candidatus Sulfomarinibacteraceae bacterium]
MIRTRWQKVIIDLWRNRTRTLVVALAIAVGVYAVGGVLNTRELLVREFERDQAGARVSDATITTTPFTGDFARRITRIPGVAAAEGRHTTQGRLYRTATEWEDITIISVPDFHDMQVDAVTPLQGQFPPVDREILMERLALDYMGAAVGDEMVLEMSNGAKKALTISGTVHDPQQFSPDLFGSPIGYVTPDTMHYLGAGRQFSELRIRVEGDGDDRPYVRSITNQIEDQVESSGRVVLSTTFPLRFIRPIIDTLVMIISTFGATILLLSGFLVINAISALITQQIQQIGVMKLVGARRRQIIVLYLVTVLVYGIIAVVVGLPLSIWSARFFMSWQIELMLNIVPDSYDLPAPLLASQVLIGLLLPVLAGLIPVWKGTRVTTFQALNDIGVKTDSQGHGLLEPLLAQLQKVGVLKRDLVLAVRNTLRHKARLAQTLFVLTFGTALFIAVLTVRSSVNQTIDDFLRFYRYDVSVGFSQPQRTARLQQIALGLPDVVRAEYWTIGGGARVLPDGSQSNFFRLYAVPPDTEMMEPQVDEGRWLQPGDTYAIVLNSDVIDDEPDLSVGDEMRLTIGGRESTWRIVGVVPTVAQGPAVYVPYETHGYITRTPGQATHIQVITNEHDAASQARVEQALFAAYEAQGIDVNSTHTSRWIETQNGKRFNLVVLFLIIMALLLAAVGGLGLTTTMSINILERIREIGILRAIGASNFALRRIVLAEGLFIGILSWTLGVLLSIPVGVLMSEQVGIALLGVPLTFQYSMPAAISWFFALLIIAAAASLGPARNAVRLTVREVLAYE